jgi:hypothetical protein
VSDPEINKVTSEDYSQIPRGKYRHYKQKEYELIDIVHHSETQEPLALYRALYGDFDLWVRPLSMFLETVEIGGRKVPRFEYIED